MNILWRGRNQHLSDVFKQEKIHSCLISASSSLIYEYHKNKKQQKNLHKINSCTKSITSALVGIAHEQGYIPSLSTPIAEYFPMIVKDPDPRKHAITIDHLLTMTAGFHWPEMEEWGGWPHMIHSSHWVNDVLEQPLAHAPGEKMNYNSGCSHLLMAILQKTTGIDVRQFAEEHLFSQLKFGQLYLNHGQWNGKQLVSADWIELTTQPAFLTYEHFGYYGRHWWCSVTPQNERFYYAMGLGGQYICVIPSRDMVITFTCDTKGDTVVPLGMVRGILEQED